MNMMRHCRQCRADAVGLLGEDRGAEFTIEKIEAMDVDYAAAMQTRAAVHEGIRKQLGAGGRSPDQCVPGVPWGTRPVLIAVASRGGGVVNEHFGHAREFLVYEASPMGVRFIGHRKTDLYCSGGDTCGDAEATLNHTIRSLAGCEAVLCSKIGFEPWEHLEAAGIQPDGEHAMEPIEQAVAAVYLAMFQDGRLTEASTRVKAG